LDVMNLGLILASPKISTYDIPSKILTQDFIHIQSLRYAESFEHTTSNLLTWKRSPLATCTSLSLLDMLYFLSVAPDYWVT